MKLTLKQLTSVRVIVDDTGGPFSGWPSIVARDDADMTLVHRAGFKQEHWGDLTQAQAVALAHEMAEAINSANEKAHLPAPAETVARKETNL